MTSRSNLYRKDKQSLERKYLVAGVINKRPRTSFAGPVDPQEGSSNSFQLRDLSVDYAGLPAPNDFETAQHDNSGDNEECFNEDDENNESNIDDVNRNDDYFNDHYNRFYDDDRNFNETDDRFNDGDLVEVEICDVRLILATWQVNYNISNNAMNALLSGLGKIIKDLPKSAKTLNLLIRAQRRLSGRFS